MTFTFGIITGGGDMNRVLKVIDSIKNNGIPHDMYEIIVVGGDRTIANDNIRYVAFNENLCKAWITKKKNRIVSLAKYENIVFMHDYISLDPFWYRGFIKYGNVFDICINPMQNQDGSRYRDLTLFPGFRTLERIGIKAQQSTDLSQSIEGMGEHECLIPYENYDENTDLLSWMYISGAYWVAKHHVMQEFPLDESLSWGQGEDVLWSEQVKTKYRFSFNPVSKCVLLKHKHPVFDPLTLNTIKVLQERGLLK